MSVQVSSPGTNSLVPSALSSYSRFKSALKSKEVQRQYPNLFEKFLDYCKFEGVDMEQKANAKSKLHGFRKFFKTQAEEYEILEC